MDNSKKYDPKDERGWNIRSWEELRVALSKMGPHSKLYKVVQAEMKKRGNWRNAPRGEYPKSGSQDT